MFWIAPKRVSMRKNKSGILGKICPCWTLLVMVRLLAADAVACPLQLPRPEDILGGW